MILVNALFFAMADYQHVDEDNNLIADGSIRNQFLIETTLFFTIVFTIECVVKVIAQGFVGNNGSYLSDSWNRLDFLVVVTALLVLSNDSIPSVSSIRLIRILRPLRSLTMLPGLRDIIKSIFKSLPELGGVFSLLAFVFLVFAIAGMELFGGASGHARCRATPYPVTTDWTTDMATGSYVNYRCLNDTNFDTLEGDPHLGKSTSPWASKRDCYWPLATESTVDGEDSDRLCSLTGGGLNPCINNVGGIDESLWSWCGSNFDAAGNKRFKNADQYGDSNPTGKKMYGNGYYPLNDKDIFISDLNYGYTNFDNFGTSCLTIFQVITLEGWSHILYMNMDAWGSGTAGLFFTLLILTGCFFVLQLLLAVLEDNFHTAKASVQAADEEAKKIAEEANRKDAELRKMMEKQKKTTLAALSIAAMGGKENHVSMVRRMTYKAVNKFKSLLGKKKKRERAAEERIKRNSRTQQQKAKAASLGLSEAEDEGEDDFIHDADNLRSTKDGSSGDDQDTPTDDNNKDKGLEDNGKAKEDFIIPSEEVGQSNISGKSMMSDLTNSDSEGSVDNDTYDAFQSSPISRSTLNDINDVLPFSQKLAGYNRPNKAKLDDSDPPPQRGRLQRKNTFGGGILNFINIREHEKIMERLDHLTLEEFVGTTIAEALESFGDDCKNTFTHYKNCFVEGCVKMMTPEESLPTVESEKTLGEKFKELCIQFATWKYFEALTGGFILANCITLMADHYPMDSTVETVLEITNALLTIIFTVEMIVNVTAFGFKYYLKDSLTSFDAVVVAASLVDLALAPPKAWGSTGIDFSKVSSISSVISMMRCFRLFRMIKLAIRVQSLKVLFFRVAKTAMDLSTYMILLMVLILIYTVVGLQFFANTFHFDANGQNIKKIGTEAWVNAYEVARYNFDDFSSSFASVFQIITTENWNDINNNTFRVYGPGGVLFPMTLILVGTFILMNLFLGILLSNFENVDESEDHDHSEKDDQRSVDSDKRGTSGESGVGILNANTPIFTGQDDVSTTENSIPPDSPPISSTENASTKAQNAVNRKPSLVASKATLSKIATAKEMDLFGLKVHSQGRHHSVHENSDDNDKDNPLRQTAKVTPMKNSDENINKDEPLRQTAKVTPLSITTDIENAHDEGEHAIREGSAFKDTDNNSENENHEVRGWPILKGFLKTMSGLVSPSKNRVVPQNESDPTKEKDVVVIKGDSKVHNRSVVHQSDLVPTANSDSPKDPLEKNDEDKNDRVFPLIPVNSLGLMSATNPFRVFCGHIVEHPWFETVIQVLILLSSISLAVDSPLSNPDSDFSKGMYYFEIFTTFVFTSECLIKIIVFGFALHKGAYLRSGWNILDFVIVIISLTTLFNSDSSLSALKSIRSLRALRPLRVISRAPGLRTLVNAVFDSVPDVINVLAVVLVCFSIFAVVGVNFLKGDLRHCDGSHFQNHISNNTIAMNLLENPISYNSMSSVQQDLFTYKSTIASFGSCDTSTKICCSDLPSDYDIAPTGKQLCHCWGSQWKAVAYITFDNYPSALMGFFAISTTEGWVDLMYAAVDATGIDMQPRLNMNYGYIYFFVLFIIAGNFFALNLFVGVMIDNFEKTKKAQRKEFFGMTAEQQEWVKAKEIVMAIKPNLHPIRPEDWIGGICFDICQTHAFEYAIIFFIFFNTIVLAADFFGIDDTSRLVFDNLNTSFAYLFTLEMIIKLVALRRCYFQSVWNLFDFAVTVGSDIGIVYFLITGNKGAMAVMVVRIFRVLRVVRLMEGLDTAKRLLDTLVYTLPGIINISLLLLLMLFIYAVLGMQLFAKTQYNGNYSVHANFRTFPNSLLTLVRFATGEGWGDFMYDASENVDGCVDDPEYRNDMCGFNDKPGCTPLNGCGKLEVFPYLLSFTLFVSMVLFNLFVGVIIEGFAEANDVSKSLKTEDFQTFVNYWAKFDPEATCFISIENLEELIATLPVPLGIKDYEPNHKEVVDVCCKLDLNVYSIHGHCNYVHFKQVLMALMTQRIMEDKSCDLVGLKKSNYKFTDDATYKMTVRSAFTTVPRHSRAADTFGEKMDVNSFTLAEHYASIVAQAAYRNYVHRKMVGSMDGVTSVSQKQKGTAAAEDGNDEHEIENKEVIRSLEKKIKMDHMYVEDIDEQKRDLSGVSMDSKASPQPHMSKTNSVDTQGSQ
jgi:hypothetical protein